MDITQKPINERFDTSGRELSEFYAIVFNSHSNEEKKTIYKGRNVTKIKWIVFNGYMCGLTIEEIKATIKNEIKEKSN